MYIFSFIMSCLLSRNALIKTDANIIFNINADIINPLLVFIYAFLVYLFFQYKPPIYNCTLTLPLNSGVTIIEMMDQS